MLFFALILAVVATAIFVGLKIAFLIFLGIVAVVIILIGLLVGSFIQCGSGGDNNHGPLDKVLFGDKGNDH